MLSDATNQQIRNLLRPAHPSDNKYSRGVVGFVTGSEKYPGAALLGIEAALQTGIGMVCYDGPAVVSQLVLLKRPEVLMNLDRVDSLVVGSGFEASDQHRLNAIQSVIPRNLPIVFDAGSLDIVDFEALTCPAILTPHWPEAIRLANRFGIKTLDFEAAKDAKLLAREISLATSKVVLIKGSITEIAAPSGIFVSHGPGNPNLATAGTGDALAGVIGALLAKLKRNQLETSDENLVQVALLANLILSKAAEISSSRGEFGASEIVAAISEAIRAELA